LRRSECHLHISVGVERFVIIEGVSDLASGGLVVDCAGLEWEVGSETLCVVDSVENGDGR
jgi:hypothetical protein